MLFRRKETPWEVVDSKSVDPVCLYYDDDLDVDGKTCMKLCIDSLIKLTSCVIDLEIVAIKNTNVTRTYLVDIKDDARQSVDLRKAVIFAREQLLQEAKKNGYNMLWLERYYLPYFLLESSV